MKRLIAGFLLWCAGAVGAATLTPVQLLNPAGSTTGQGIVSNGPSSAPTWQTLPYAPLAGATFTGNLAITKAAGTSRVIEYQSSGSRRWAVYAGPGAESGGDAGSDFAVESYTDGGLFKAIPFSITRSSGVASFSARPVFAGNTPWDSGNLIGPAVTSLTLAQFQPTTSAQLAGVITNETGSGVLVFGTSPTLTTPNIVGTATNDSAPAGSVGEYQTNSATGTALTTATFNNSVTRSLTAGDWDVECVNTFNPAGSTTVTLIQSGVSTTSATSGGIGTGVLLQATLTTGGAQIQITPVVRISLAATTTVYCIAAANFGVSTMTVDGFIRARRVR